MQKHCVKNYRYFNKSYIMFLKVSKFLIVNSLSNDANFLQLSLDKSSIIGPTSFSWFLNVLYQNSGTSSDANKVLT